MRSSAKRLWSDQSGAIAAVYALALPALIAVGGIAFDYARLAAMDTELQNAADQAALAAVTQLDGQEGAVSRATNAASALVSNNTVFSNDGGGPGVSIATVTFYADLEGETVVDPDDADADTDARFVEVTVGAREAVYALTPVVSAFRSGDMDATAMAGSSTSICNVPPLYMAFDPDSEDLDRLTPGTGVLLLGAESASQFGYLANGKGGDGLKDAMSWDQQVGDCQASGGVENQTGVVSAVKRGFNTRFDSGPGGGGCPNGGTCSTAADTTVFNRDSCHASGNSPITPVAPCTTVIGDGVYAGQVSSQTRYERYKELIGSSYDFDTDRRRLTIAVIPYGAFGTGGSGDPVTPTRWLDVFITEPMDGDGAAKKEPLRFYVEIIGESSPATSGRRDVPYIIR
jgi:Flp pilus assembly protein TadG